MVSSGRGAALVALLALAVSGCSNGDKPEAGMDMAMPPVADMALGPDLLPAPTCITPATPQSCTAPVNTALPICTLALTGCMDATKPTQPAAKAIYYEVNSPLWSDNAAKSRALVLPDGGKIHVKNCGAGARPEELAECMSPGGIPNGAAETGKWVLPVGTVLIKNFLFDGKLVETRLLMRVDAATAALIQNGTDWVGYNYQWNEAQTEAVVVPAKRTHISFATGKRTVSWTYPSSFDCIGCHAAAVGPIGLEMAQMNRTVNAKNQIDAFAALGLFDKAPAKPYPAAMVEPYANPDLGLNGPGGASIDKAARSYLAANCAFCHRPDVNDRGFDLRFSMSLFETKICGITAQDGIPGHESETFLDLAPGKHADSAMWIRMSTPVPDGDPTEIQDYGRMPPAASVVVDPQAVDLVGKWIDSIASCPTK